jgi:hypothetical protein
MLQPGKTYRITGIPLEWDSQRLQTWLAEKMGLSAHDSAVDVMSLATEVSNRFKTATVTFEQSDNIQNATTLQESIDIRLPQEETSGRPKYITIDKRFLGITTLFSPPPEDHKIDVVAIHGLGGHACGSFKARNSNHTWIRDELPFNLTTNDRPIARIMTYGYDSVVAESQSMQQLPDIAEALNRHLLPLTESTRMRPIIFIAHSLGGLALKQALIRLEKSKDENDQRLLQAVYGIACFGVPHRGMDNTALISMTGDRGSNRALVESLSRDNSAILRAQHEDFATALGGADQSEVICFYETSLSPTAEKVCPKQTMNT